MERYNILKHIEAVKRSKYRYSEIIRLLAINNPQMNMMK